MWVWCRVGGEKEYGIDGKEGIMKIQTNTLTTDLFLELYTSVGWEPPCREQVECALQNTTASFVAYEGEKAIGMIRLIGDGGMSFYIKDFAVLPECQGKGVGKKLLSELQQYISEHIDKGWAVSLELISTKEAVNFYKAYGFEERPCEWEGPGMFKMIEKGKL